MSDHNYVIEIIQSSPNIVEVQASDTSPILQFEKSEPRYSYDILNFDDAVNQLIKVKSLIGGDFIYLTESSGNYTISVSGLSLDNYSFSSAQITDFVPAVSGLLPITSIIGGDNISIVSSGSLYSISVSGQLGLTAEEVDDRVSQLLIAGQNILLSYNDNLNTLTVSTSGLQPSGDYSIVGHTHVIADVSGLQLSLDGKQPSGIYASGIHTHLVSDITNFSSGVSGLLTPYALLNSPNFSGIPTAPTASSGDNSTQIANTSFVRGEIASLVGSAPSTLDTLNELALALGNDPNFATTITNSLSDKVSKSGDTMTGTLIAPSGSFNSLKVNNVNVSVSGHQHNSTDIQDLTSSVSGILDSFVTTNISGVNGIDIQYNSVNNTLLFSTSGVSFVGHNHTYSEISDLTNINLNFWAVPTGNLSLNNNRITNLATPTASGDATNKNYIDNLWASTSSRGIASFNSSNFAVTSGNVSIKNSGITNSLLEYDYFNLGLSKATLGSSLTSISGLIIDGGSP